MCQEEEVIVVGGGNSLAKMLDITNAAILSPRGIHLSNAIPFRPMIPLVPDTLPNSSSKHILISAGAHECQSSGRIVDTN